MLPTTKNVAKNAACIPTASQPGRLSFTGTTRIMTSMLVKPYFSQHVYHLKTIQGQILIVFGHSFLIKIRFFLKYVCEV